MRVYRGGGQEKKAEKPLETGKSGVKGMHVKNIYLSAVTCRLQRVENPAWCIQEIVAQATAEISVMHWKEYEGKAVVSLTIIFFL